MANDPNGIYMYENADTINNWATFMNLGMSSVSNVIEQINRRLVHTASTPVEAANLVSKYAPSPGSVLLAYRTDLNKLMVNRGNGEWEEVNPLKPDNFPYMIKSGTASRPSVPVNGNITVQVNFGSDPSFTQLPCVTAIADSSRLTCSLRSSVSNYLTTSSVSISVDNWSNNIAGPGNIHWMAIQTSA